VVVRASRTRPPVGRQRRDTDRARRTEIDCLFSGSPRVVTVTSAEPSEPEWTRSLTSRAYRITVDDGQESFFALSIEQEDDEGAWIISDTVVALENVR